MSCPGAELPVRVDFGGWARPRVRLSECSAWRRWGAACYFNELVMGVILANPRRCLTGNTVDITPGVTFKASGETSGRPGLCPRAPGPLLSGCAAVETQGRGYTGRDTLLPPAPFSCSLSAPVPSPHPWEPEAVLQHHGSNAVLATASNLGGRTQ